MTLLLAAGWVALVVLCRRSRPVVAHRLASPAPARRSVTGRLGDRIQARVPHVRTLRSGLVGAAAVIAVVLLAFDPVVALMVVAGVGFGAFVMRLAAQRARRARLLEELPATIEILRMAVGAGSTFPAALDLVAVDLEGELGTVLRWVQARRAHGDSLADALEALAEREGEPLEGVLTMLVVAQRSGSPVVDALAQAAARQRAELRRASETRVRRLPISMLLPLIACVMPAFVLLTIVPLLGGQISKVHLP